MKKLITVFTPTYNRAYVLGKLYASLCNQTSDNYCWLIVDDGSTDNTKELVMKWQEEERIDIQYYWQENQGKAAAHNKGVELTETELFTCVDSDDYLTPNAVETIIETWKKETANENNYVGILAYKAAENSPITRFRDKVKSATLMNCYHKYGLSGDTFLIFKKEILSQYCFPKIENEKFVPEAYLYDLIDQDGEFYILHEALYIANYLADGYTKNMRKTIKRNPNGYLLYINQRLALHYSLSNKLKDVIRYIAVKKCTNCGIRRIIREAVYPGLTVLCILPGYLFYFLDYRKADS